jgi:hypothetical protein
MSASNTTTVTVTYVLEPGPAGRHTGFPGIVAQDLATRTTARADGAQHYEFEVGPLHLKEPVTPEDIAMIAKRFRVLAAVAEVAAIANQNAADEVATLAAGLRRDGIPGAGNELLP